VFLFGCMRPAIEKPCALSAHWRHYQVRASTLKGGNTEDMRCGEVTVEGGASSFGGIYVTEEGGFRL
jgi:hypothetical protein